MTDFCRELARVGGEPLAGSAAEVRVWFALEYHDVWEPKPLGPSHLPEEVKDHLEGWLARVPGSRHQFIRRPDGPAHGTRTLLVARSDGDDPWTLRFELGSYLDLLDLDLEGIVAAGAHPNAERLAAPVYLVCCHGKRDRCCAKWGVALFGSVQRAAPDATWQTTHLGGHRFAATLAVLPHGICYGHLEGGEGVAIVAAHARGEIYDLDRMRGRSALSPAAQVAEIEVRRRTADRSLPGPRVDAVEVLPDGGTRVRVGDHEVRVAPERLPGLRPKSCGDAPSPIDALRVLD